MSNIEDNTNCMECGNAFELHSMDRRCPKNGGFQINGKLEFFATHFEPEISETDQLRAELARLTAGSEAMQKDAANNTITVKMLMAQLAEMKAPIEDIKYYVGNPSAWEHYDDGVSEKIRAILKATGMA